MKLTVKVLNQKHIQFSVTGNSQSDVKNTLQAVAHDFQKNMQDDYTNRKTQTEKYLSIYRNKLSSNEALLKKINQSVKWSQLSQKDVVKMSHSIAKTEGLINKYQESVKSMENDLAFFERPRVLGVSYSKASSHVFPNSIIAFALSLFLTILSFMLWKYVRDAKKARRIND